MNHDYIGSFWQCQMSQKPEMYLGIIININATKGNRFLVPFTI